jgi:hypothetical protein
MASPGERHQLAAPEAGVDRSRPHRPVALRDRGEQLHRLFASHVPLAGVAHRRDLHAAGRTNQQFVTVNGAAVDGAERADDGVDRGRCDAIGHEVIDQVLDVDAADGVELRAAEAGVGAEP